MRGTLRSMLPKMQLLKVYNAFFPRDKYLSGQDGVLNYRSEGFSLVSRRSSLIVWKWTVVKYFD